ncbi:unnamed protein product [Schistocephalus solidus]|uniref:Ashwin n=1 Tax=Schistocephalus solidus TaxID=70667 RepID=A0A183TE74_SCHSO|nr:unnamed protein product [Schistocephalus solidus]
MDDVELIMPWEKQTGLLPYPHRKVGQVPRGDTSSPVRKSLSYAGIVSYKQSFHTPPGVRSKFPIGAAVAGAAAVDSSKTGLITGRPRSLTTSAETTAVSSQRQGPKNKLNPLISRISNKLRIRDSAYFDREDCFGFSSNFIRFITYVSLDL